MTTLSFNYVSMNKYVEPQWMREERYMYCEQKPRTSNAFWSCIKKLFF